MYHIWTLFHPLNRWVTLPWYSNTMGSWKFSLLRKTDASSRPLHRRTVSLVFWSHSYLKLLASDFCVRLGNFNNSDLSLQKSITEQSRIIAFNSTFLQISQRWIREDTWKTGRRISRGLSFWQRVGPLFLRKKRELLPAKYFSFQSTLCML